MALEITRGRALAEMGDHGAAKQALAAALDQNPDNADALDAFADLCLAESDFSGAEQAWIRLARHVTAPERQIEIYTKLGNLYDSEPNTPRADAGNGLWLRGDGRGRFVSVSPRESGLLAPRNVSGLALVGIPTGKALLVANTGDSLQAFAIRMPGRPAGPVAAK